MTSDKPRLSNVAGGASRSFKTSFPQNSLQRRANAVLNIIDETLFRDANRVNLLCDRTPDAKIDAFLHGFPLPSRFYARLVELLSPIDLWLRCAPGLTPLGSASQGLPRPR